MDYFSKVGADGDSGLSVLWEDGERVSAEESATPTLIGLPCWPCCPPRSIQHLPLSIALLANTD